MDQGRLNKRVGGYVKQMSEETEKLKITDKNYLDREQYGNFFFLNQVSCGKKRKKGVLHG